MLSRQGIRLYIHTRIVNSTIIMKYCTLEVSQYMHTCIHVFLWSTHTHTALVIMDEKILCLIKKVCHLLIKFLKLDIFSFLNAFI